MSDRLAVVGWALAAGVVAGGLILAIHLARGDAPTGDSFGPEDVQSALYSDLFALREDMADWLRQYGSFSEAMSAPGKTVGDFRNEVAARTETGEAILSRIEMTGDRFVRRVGEYAASGSVRDLSISQKDVDDWHRNLDAWVGAQRWQLDPSNFCFGDLPQGAEDWQIERLVL